MSRASPEEAARGMLRRYLSAKVASEMAHFHACDYRVGDERRTYWEAVKTEMNKILKHDSESKAIFRAEEVDS
jgi:hypothetical protein